MGWHAGGAVGDRNETGVELLCSGVRDLKGDVRNLHAASPHEDVAGIKTLGDGGGSVVSGADAGGGKDQEGLKVGL